MVVCVIAGGYEPTKYEASEVTQAAGAESVLRPYGARVLCTFLDIKHRASFIHFGMGLQEREIRTELLQWSDMKQIYCLI